MIPRKEYLDRLIEQREQKIIKVITGVRCCGKSTLLSLYIDYLKSKGVQEEQIISVNLEAPENESILDYKALYAYIKKRVCKDKFTYVFIDEVQLCKDFEKAVNSLFIMDNVDIYITGSNAFMPSGELATLLSGRYVQIEMLPLSFREFHSVAGYPSKAESFAAYLKFGSFPYLAAIDKKDSIIYPYIDGIYNTILIKDVAKREGITDVTLLESIVKCVANSIGSPISSKKIADTITSYGTKLSVNTVNRYLKVLCDSYIFYKAERYDIRGKRPLKTPGKYYIVDTGIWNMHLTENSANIEYVLENVIYLELLRRGYKVSTGKWSEKEVDFVAVGYKEIIYFQVSASVADSKTLERELAPLRKIADNHPKYLLTLDEIGNGSNYDGILQKNVLDWLLEV